MTRIRPMENRHRGCREGIGMRTWEIAGEFELSNKQLTEVVLGIAHAAREKGGGPLDASIIRELVDWSTLPVPQEKPRKPQTTIINGVFALLVEAGLAVFHENDSKQIRAGEQLSALISQFGADRAGAETQLLAWLLPEHAAETVVHQGGDSGVALDEATRPALEPYSEPQPDLPADETLPHQQLDDAVVLAEPEMAAAGYESLGQGPGPEPELTSVVADNDSAVSTLADEDTSVPEQESAREVEEPMADDRGVYRDPPGGGSNERTPRGMERGFAKSGKGRRISGAPPTPPPDEASAGLEHDADDGVDAPAEVGLQESIETGYEDAAQEADTPDAAPVEPPDDAVPPLPGVKSWDRETADLPDPTPAIRHAAASEPAAPRETSARDVRDQTQVQGPRSGWLERMLKGAVGSKSGATSETRSKSEPESSALPPQRTVPNGQAPQKPTHRITNGAVDLAPKGPRAVKNNTPASPESDDEIIPLPLLRPDGTQMKIARRDFERLVDEHGSVSNALAFLATFRQDENTLQDGMDG
ncbi:MAG: hypothetical protein GX573_21055 [Chloroflexi bacterium]|nr:hypothetical protein [Chloroflexota bacterium]